MSIDVTNLIIVWKKKQTFLNDAFQSGYDIFQFR